MALEYQHLLLAVDGSREAEWAFKKSIEIARRNNAKLNIVHVVESRPFTGVEVYDPSLEEHAFKLGKELLAKYKKEAEQTDIPNVNVILAVGSPKYLITGEIAKQVNADLIICGATGLNAIQRFIIGSVSEHIVRESRCDVLVVRTKEHAKANS